jgi:hypothetical protein
VDLVMLRLLRVSLTGILQFAIPHIAGASARKFLNNFGQMTPFPVPSRCSVDALV